MSVRTFPALEIAWPAMPPVEAVERLLAALDDAAPTAVEDHNLGVRIFFGTEEDRDTAATIVLDDAPEATVTSLLVPDENWAERSQAALQPVRIGDVVVSPPWALDAARQLNAGTVIAIQPSMGFGTGHHPSTRLCLQLLQRHGRRGGAVLDIGTGSGVLAIAAWRLGAASAIGVDFDRDALISAAENIEHNNAAAGVTLDVVDITQGPASLASRFDLVFANITGGMLCRHAAHVASTLNEAGVLITSGFQEHERDDVAQAFAGAGLAVTDTADEETWVALAFQRLP